MTLFIIITVLAFIVLICSIADDIRRMIQREDRK